jgi:hypothetical protein
MWRASLFILLAFPAAAVPPEFRVLHATRNITGSPILEVRFDKNLIAATSGPVRNDCQIADPASESGSAGLVNAASPDRITFVLSALPAAGTKFKVKCGFVEYYDGSVLRTLRNLEESNTIPAGSALHELLLQKLEKQTKAAKKTKENIFASGFVTTASSGSAGGADISFSPDLKIPNFRPFLQIKKTTQGGADAKNFEAGGVYQVAFISNKKAYEAIRGMGGSGMDAILTTFNRNGKSAYGRAFAGSTLDLAFKMEGSAGNFEVTNFVGESAFVLRSNTAALLGQRGFFRGFLMLGALEGGQSNTNLTGDAANLLKPDWIARYKSGLGFRLHFEDTKHKLPIQRVELSGDGVLRNLFRAEAMWDEKAKAVNRTGKGVRAYGQLDLKLYVGDAGSGRYGVKLSYARGNLPPVFARVKTFQFGFLWESKDAQ